MTWTRRKVWIVGAALALALGASGWWWSRRPAWIQAIVVKPFAGQATLAEPLRQEVLEDLARIPGLRIVNEPAAPPAVTGVLEAQVERSADRIRIVAELSRADGHHYWTRTLDRPIADLPVIAEDVASAVNGKARRKKAPKYKPALTAYDAYLDGRYRFGCGDFANMLLRSMMPSAL